MVSLALLSETITASSRRSQDAPPLLQDLHHIDLVLRVVTGDDEVELAMAEHGQIVPGADDVRHADAPYDRPVGPRTSGGFDRRR